MVLKEVGVKENGLNSWYGVGGWIFFFYRDFLILLLYYFNKNKDFSFYFEIKNLGS